MDLSLDERKKLALQFRKEMTKKKAAELGMNPDEVTAKVKNGQLIWVKRADLYQQLEKQRKVAGPEKVVRALRDGENSLKSKIEKDIRITRMIADEMTKANIITMIERNDIMSSIAHVQRRFSGIITELQTIEESIERAKKSDDVLKEGEEVLKEMKSAAESGNTQMIAQLRSLHKDLLTKYENRRKSLDPLITSARHCRADMQREYWRIYQNRWKLQGITFKYYLKDIATISTNLPDGPVKDSFQEELTLLHEDFEKLLGQHNQLSVQYPDTTADPTASMKAWDEILPSMKTLIEEQDFLFESLQSLIAKYQPYAAKTEETAQRMVFIEQKNQ
ncbi:MAG: hypothetical protein C4527_00990 [Candidatus Omnitrophota bacterium]|jgi:hypothetical protein|nr:MAG: hypothetical protein C4527_00990 [Candidatus Omnitrophota bacterium]